MCEQCEVALQEERDAARQALSEAILIIEGSIGPWDEKTLERLKDALIFESKEWWRG